VTAPAVGGTTLQRRLLGRGVLLEAATVGWNVIEAGVALIAGLVAGSGWSPELRSSLPAW